MTTRQTPGATPAPIAATLNTPPWARAETPQGRSQAESRSRTADRAAHTPADDTTQVSAVLDLSAQGSSIMTRDNVPAPVQPPDPAPAPQQPAVGAGLTAAIGQGAAEGAARSITARLMDKFLTSRRLAQSPVARATEALGVTATAGQDGPARPFHRSRVSRGSGRARCRRPSARAPPGRAPGTRARPARLGVRR